MHYSFLGEIEFKDLGSLTPRLSYLYTCLDSYPRYLPMEASSWGLSSGTFLHLDILPSQSWPFSSSLHFAQGSKKRQEPLAYCSLTVRWLPLSMQLHLTLTQCHFTVKMERWGAWTSLIASCLHCWVTEGLIVTLSFTPCSNWLSTPSTTDMKFGSVLDHFHLTPILMQPFIPHAYCKAFEFEFLHLGIVPFPFHPGILDHTTPKYLF